MTFIQFWATPDSELFWQALHQIGIAYIKDQFFELAQIVLLISI